MTCRVYEPRAFAGLAMAHFRDRPRVALWAKPGMGKTSLVLNHLDIRHRVWGESRPSLILGPLRVAQSVWTDEAAKWQHLAGLDVVPIVGTAEERLAALRIDAPVKTINYENLPWLRKQYPGARWPFKLVVADESTKLKGFRLRQGGVRARAIGEVAQRATEEWINLTGTPSPNGLKDLWGQTWFLDAGERLGRTYAGFEERYFAYKRIKDAVTHKVGIVPVLAPHAEELIHEKLADLCLALDPKDWFDLHEPVVTVIEVVLPAAARAQYRVLEKEMFVRLDTGDVEAFNAAALTMKCLQFANGAVYLAEQDDVWQLVHDEKLDALEDLIEELGEPLLVAYHFKHDLQRLKARFPEGADLATKDGMAAAKAGLARVMFGHPASVGHGVDGLQEHCRAIAFFGHWWDLEQYDQIVERVGAMRQYQAGKDQPMFIYHIVAKGTVDEVVVARRASKRAVQDVLMDYMKEKR